MTTPHKYAEVIKAWADGKTIQYSHNGVNWYNRTWRDGTMGWGEGCQYRIKPEDSVVYRGVRGKGFTSPWFSLEQLKECESTSDAYIKLVYDGETDKLKSVEIVSE